ncbi:F0F1 ATP synthase subunit delta [Schlesneria sp.]|uniref:F0F1 ATP synthase subunit delta n=1 Tax=Schlesneria sp. TaxID=2762018 RepID=UPI002EF1BC78
MQIDWFTLIAQIINFAILVWLLHYLLYDRIVRAMDEREKKIVSQLESAAEERKAAAAEKETYRARIHEADQQKQAMLAEAKQEAEAYRQQLIKKAEANSEEVRSQWYEALERERTEILDDVQEKVAQQVVSITRHAMNQIANTDLESQVLNAFLNHWDALDEREHQAMVDAAREASGHAEVRTSFPVAEDLREQLRTHLAESLKQDLEIEFTTIPELICGIELRIQSQRLVWSLDSYLTDLENVIFQSIEEKVIEHGKPQSDKA